MLPSAIELLRSRAATFKSRVFWSASTSAASASTFTKIFWSGSFAKMCSRNKGGQVAAMLRQLLETERGRPQGRELAEQAASVGIPVH